MTTLVQSKAASAATAITLDAAPTPGSLLVMVIERPDVGMNNSVALPTPGTWVHVDSTGATNYVQAHGAFGGRGRLFVKRAESGDAAGPWTTGGVAVATILAEFAGVDATDQLAAAETADDMNNAAAISLAVPAPGRPALVLGAVVTRLRGGAGGTVTPAAGTSKVPAAGNLPDTGVGHDSPVLLWADDPTGGGVTLAGTQSGSTQDGYWWGMQTAAFGWPTPTFPPRFW